MRMATKSRDSGTNTVRVIKNQHNVSISTKTVSVVKSKDNIKNKSNDVIIDKNTIVRVVKKCDSTKTSSKKIVKDDDVEDLDDVEDIVLEKLECQYGGNCKKLCSEEECTACFNRSFASSFKKHFWSEKNELTQREVFLSSSKKFLFLCNVCDHDYWTSLSNMCQGVTNKCPFCVNQKLCSDGNCDTCFNKSFASSLRSQCWSKRNDVDSRDVFKSSNKHFIFDCDVCKHEFKTTLAHVTWDTWCPYCENKKLCSNDGCNFCYNKSFASVPIEFVWSEKNDITPMEIFKFTHKKYIFNCDVCNHQFEKRPNDIISKNGGCPYCVNTKLCSDKNCKICFAKSFASVDKSKHWSPKNIGMARDVFKYSDKKFLFDCIVCKHEFQGAIKEISRKNQWCPYCENQKLCTNLSCSGCFWKSFLSNEKCIYWSTKNNVKPRDVFLQSNIKYIFNCKSCGYEYESTLSHVTNGRWCKCTKNKTEIKLKDWLIKNGFNIIAQPRYEWSRNIKSTRCLPFDFSIEVQKIIIELDGGQHFKQVRNWSTPEETTSNDVYKMRVAIENGYTIIRLLQEDVWNNKNDWENKLKECIDTHVINNKSYYFLCTNNEYNTHEKLLIEALNNDQ